MSTADAYRTERGDATVKEAGFSVLLLGSSVFTYSETEASPTIPTMVERELEAREPAVHWRCNARVMWETENSAAKASAFAQRFRADVVIYDLSVFRFLHEAVVFRVRNRWPRLYPLASSIMEMLRTAGGGTFNGGRDLRGAVFRFPRRVAMQTIGTDVDLAVDAAVHRALEAVDALLTLEDVAVIMSMPKFYWHVPKGHEGRYEQRTNAARQLLSEYCLKRHIPTYDLLTSLAKAGRTLGLARDQLHYDLATSEFESRLIADAVCETLGVRSKVHG